MKTSDPWYEYTSEYRKKNPEKVRQWRINSYINYLVKNGYTVIKAGTQANEKAPAEWKAAGGCPEQGGNVK